MGSLPGDGDDTLDISERQVSVDQLVLISEAIGGQRSVSRLVRAGVP